MAGLVSVVIPCFNCEEFVESAILSVFNQTYKNVEVLAVDDKSSDSTKNVLESLANEFPGRMKVIPGEGKGSGPARNRGVDHSEGELIAFLDADDFWLPQKLEKQLDRLDRAGTECLIYTGRRWVDSEGNVTGQPSIDAEFPEGMIFSELISGNYVCTSTVLLYKSSFIEVGGFSANKNFKNCQDYHLWLRLSRIVPFYAVNEPLCSYRIHDKNTHKNLHSRYIGMVSCLHYVQEKVGNQVCMINPRDEIALRTRFRNIHQSYARSFFRLGDYGAAGRAGLSAFRYGERGWRVIVIIILTRLPDRILDFMIKKR